MTWRTVSLGEVLPFKYGKALPERLRSSTGEFDVLSSAGVVGTHNAALTTGPSVVIGRKGSIGTVYLCPRPVWPIDTAFYVVGSDEVDVHFAYYLLRTLPLGEMNNDSAVPGLNRAHAESLKVRLPSMPEQEAIASALGLIDLKIQSNLRAMGVIEQLGASYLEGGLEIEDAAAPAYEAGIDLGAKLAVCETGARPRGGALTDGSGVVSLGAESVQSAGIMNINTWKSVPLEYANSMRRGHLADEDVLVYKDGGKPGNFIPHVSAFGHGFPTEKAMINEHVFRVRAIDGVSQGLLYWILRSSWMDLEMRKRGTGAAIPGLNSSNFKSLPWPRIDASQMPRLNDTLSAFLRKLLQLGVENQRLERLRDAMLPELVSGRLEVPVGAVA